MNRILEEFFSSRRVGAPAVYTAEKAEKLEKYMHMVLEYNESVNLTAITDEDGFVVKNIIDSLSIVSDSRYGCADSVIDVGTGAGLPGIPLAVISPGKKFVLMDSLAKRVKIVSEIADALGLENVTVIHARAEDLAADPKHREKYDLCVSRAVSRLSVLAEYCLPFVARDGYMISYKGQNYADELKDARSALKKLGGRVESVDEASMEKYGLSHAVLYIFKYRNTPKEYPRRAGIPAKKPL